MTMHFQHSEILGSVPFAPAILVRFFLPSILSLQSKDKENYKLKRNYIVSKLCITQSGCCFILLLCRVAVSIKKKKSCFLPLLPLCYIYSY